MSKSNSNPDVAAIVAAVMAQMSGGGANATVAPTAIVERVRKPRAQAPTTPRPATSPASYTVTSTSYKGFPTVTFTADGRRPISLGYAKIRLVLAHADALRKIVG